MAELQQGHGGMSSRSKWVLAGFLAVGGFFLLTEHRAHLFGLLPYLLLLACPLMHLFHGHGGHGGHRGHRSPAAGSSAEPAEGPPHPTSPDAHGNP